MLKVSLAGLARFLTVALMTIYVVPAIAAPSKEWTVLIFMNGKNNLEEFAIEDFAELAKVGSSDKVDFVVQMGRPARRPGAQQAMLKVEGGWIGARRFHVSRDATVTPGKELAIVGGADVDMGSPAVFQDFLKWGKARFPAKKYAVIVWNHGQGYRLTFDAAGKSKPIASPRRPDASTLAPSHRAVSQDADTGSIIYNSDLRGSLAASFGPELSVIGFDACLMAMIETAYELKAQAPILVASEELEPGPGWNYTTLASALTAAPQSDGTAVAKMMVSSYRDNYGNGDSTTLSAVDLTKIGAAATELSRLSDMLIADRARLFPIVQTVRAGRAAYNDPNNPVSIDLIGFLSDLDAELGRVGGNAATRAQIQSALLVARSAIVENYASSQRAGNFGSSGLAIYFPASKNDFDNDSWSDGYAPANQFKKIAFVGSERWSRFLAAYLGLPQ